MRKCAPVRGNRAPVQNLITYHTRGMHGNDGVRCAVEKQARWLLAPPETRERRRADSCTRWCAAVLNLPCQAQAGGIREARTALMARVTRAESLLVRGFREIHGTRAVRFDKAASGEERPRNYELQELRSTVGMPAPRRQPK